jgi:hypothetical protein
MRIESSGVRNRRSPLIGRGELDAFLDDLAQRAQAEDLEAARIGEDRSVPAHEAMQAAVGGDDLQPRPQPEVEGVAEHDLRAEAPDLSGDMAFTVP